MKKSKFIIIIMFNFVCSILFCQQYDDVFIKGRKDKNNKIYKIGRIFYYKIKEDTIRNNEIKGIKLAVIKSNIFTRTNKNQTEISYSFYPFSNAISRTGVVENDKNIWLHPPRISFLKYLEICPFPYIKLNKEVGYKWRDKMKISDYWASVEGGEWKGELILDYYYEILGNEIIETNVGKIECTKIFAKGVSRAGNSYLSAYFSDKLGFVKLEYTLFTGKKIILEIEKIDNIIN